MGYLTHFSIYNDVIHLLDKASKEESGETAKKFCHDLYAASNKSSCYREETCIGVSNFANLVYTQVPVHADTPVLYLNTGNRLIDLSIYNDTIKHISIDTLQMIVGLSKLLIKDLEKELKVRKQNELQTNSK